MYIYNYYAYKAFFIQGRNYYMYAASNNIYVILKFNYRKIDIHVIHCKNWRTQTWIVFNASKLVSCVFWVFGNKKKSTSIISMTNDINYIMNVFHLKQTVNCLGSLAVPLKFSLLISFRNWCRSLFK